MARGFPPKPTKLKIAQGNPGHQKLDLDAEVFYPEGEPDMPKSLRKEARAEWKRIIPILREAGILSRSAVVCLTSYCDAFQEILNAIDLINKEGMYHKEPIVNSIGQVVGHKIKVHPAQKVKHLAVGRAKALAAEFGLTPASQSRVPNPHRKGAADPLQELLNRGQKSG